MIGMLKTVMAPYMSSISIIIVTLLFSDEMPGLMITSKLLFPKINEDALVSLTKRHTLFLMCMLY